MNRQKKATSFVGLLTLCIFCITLAGGQVFAKSDAASDIEILDRSSKAFVNVVKKAKPAVVHIKVEKTTKRNYSGRQGS